MGEVEAYYITLLLRQIVYAGTLYHRVQYLQRLAAYAARHDRKIREILPHISALAIRASIYTQKMAAMAEEAQAGNVVDITDSEMEEYVKVLNAVSELEARVIAAVDKMVRPLGRIWGGGGNE